MRHMKKIHILGAAVVAMLAFGVIGVASAAASPEWLAEGKAITTAKAATDTAEITIGSTNGLKIGIKTAVLCSYQFVGTVGAGAADSITEVLSLANVLVTLAAPLTCTPVETCTSATLVFVGLPWKTELLSLTDDDILNAGWEIVCKTALGTVEETCTSATQLITVGNLATDVSAVFVKEQSATCSLGGANSGFVTSEGNGASLIFLDNGETLAVS